MQTAAPSRHGYVRLSDISPARPGVVTLTVHLGDRRAVYMGTRDGQPADWRWLKKLKNGRLVGVPAPSRFQRRKEVA
jgi:hypothetical protein